MATAEERFGKTRRRNKNVVENRMVEIQPRESNVGRIISKLQVATPDKPDRAKLQRQSKTQTNSAAFDRAFGKKKR